MQTRYNGRVASAFISLAGMALAGALLAPTDVLAQGSGEATPPATTPAPQAQDEKSQEPAVPKVRVQTTLVTAPLTVMDKQGNFVSNLTVQDITVYDNGDVQNISRFDLATELVDLVIVIQANQTAGPLLDGVKPLSSIFTEMMLGPGGKVAVLTYSGQVNPMMNLGEDNSKLDTVLGGLKPEGTGARLNDAVMQAISILQNQPTGERRVIMVFSDGFDKGSSSSRQEVARVAAESNVTIYGMGYSVPKEIWGRKQSSPGPSSTDGIIRVPTGPGSAPTPTSEDNATEMPVSAGPILGGLDEIVRSSIRSTALEFYAKFTGGVCYSHWSDRAVQEAVSRIATEVQSQYELAYTPTNRDELGFHRLRVVVNRRGLRVRTRTGYINVSNPNPGEQ